MIYEALELWVEGPTDASSAGSANVASHGALPAIVRATMLAASGLAPEAFERALPANAVRCAPLLEKLRGVTGFTKKPLADGLTLFGKKVLTAHDRARAGAAVKTLIVVFSDEDGFDERVSRLAPIRRYIEGHAFDDLVVSCCVPNVEGWLVADAGAFTAAFGASPPAFTRRALLDPKRALAEALGDAGVVGSNRERYAALAAHLDLDRVARACPSFATFREDVSALFRRHH